ncbi:MAG: undecaprenyl-diphosphate phosphatase [Anaerolineae bacterium]|nr:undecaprenyl-diphosphate phosphatase [Anaerolineae bacterium]
MSDLLIAAVLGLVEGLTEFIPVSSTGHLILASELLRFTGERADIFVIFIQLGAILAVVLVYWQRFMALLSLNRRQGFNGLRGIGLLALTTVLPVVVALLAGDVIKGVLFGPIPVAIGLAAGGIAILVIEQFKPKTRFDSLDALTWREALIVGVCQCLALWPGVSRAAATILGGMVAGADRKTAAEYSFLAAVPLLAGAALYDLIKGLDVLTTADIPVFAVGFVVAFGAAWLAIRFFLRLLATTDLRVFGWYRIVLALVVFLLLAR